MPKALASVVAGYCHNSDAIADRLKPRKQQKIIPHLGGERLSTWMTKKDPYWFFEADAAGAKYADFLSVCRGSIVMSDIVVTAKVICDDIGIRILIDGIESANYFWYNGIGVTPFHKSTRMNLIRFLRDQWTTEHMIAFSNMCDYADQLIWELIH